MAESMTSPDHSETPGPAAMATPAGSETQFDLDLKRAIAESMKSPDHSETPAPAAMATPAAPAADAASGAAYHRPQLLADAPDTEASAPAACALAASASADALAASAPTTAWPSTNGVQREDKFHITDLALEQEESIDFQEALQKVKAEPSSPDDGRNLPAYVFKGHVSSEGDLTPPSLSGTSSQESMGEQDETEAAEAQAEEGDDSPAASGAPSASASCAPRLQR